MPEDPHQSPPFAGCLEAFAARALGDVAAGDQPFQDALEGGLVAELSGLAHKVLYARFDALRASGELADGGDAYQRFLDLCQHGLLDAMIAEHPALAAALDASASNWRRNGRALIDRYRADSSALVDAFGLGGSRPVSVATMLSDPHRGGRRVARIEFEDGAAIYYKPRALDPELAFDCMLVGWNMARPELALPRCRLLPRDGYGWAFGITAGGEWDEVSLRAYYRRCGALLYLVYLAGGSDFHMENVIATADGPALIDLECLMQASVGGLAPGVTGDELEASGLLPSNRRDAPDFSGFAAAGGVEAEFGVPGYRDTNTALMRQVEARATIDAEANLPRDREGRAHPPSRFLDEIQDGFREAFEFARDKADEVGRWLTALARPRFRYLIRPTDDYALFADRLRAPELLSAPDALSAEAAELVSTTKAVRAIRLNTPTTERAEAGALLAGDVPIFEFAPSGRDLACEDDVTETNFFAISGADAAAARAARSTDDDLDAALAVIRRTFEPTPLPSSAGKGPNTVLVEHADYIASKIAAELEPIPLAATPGSLDLYDGYSGVAVFLAAFGRATGDERCLRRASDILERLASTDAESDAPMVLGAAKGIGSHLLALLAMHRISTDGAWLDAALALLPNIRPEDLDSESELDLFGGLAGLLNACVEVLSAGGGGLAEQLAEHCARQLLKKLTEPELAAELNMGSLAHGRPGCLLALARYGNLRPEVALDREVIGRVLQEESFTSTLGMNAWCNGATGLAAFFAENLALQQSGSPFALDVPVELLASALRELSGGQLAATDHLCCGNVGRLAVAQRVSLLAPALLPADFVTQKAYEFALWAESKGGYSLDDSLPGNAPGLFRGLGGIGFTLLRIAEPEGLPDLAGLAIDSQAIIKA